MRPRRNRRIEDGLGRQILSQDALERMASYGEERVADPQTRLFRGKIVVAFDFSLPYRRQIPRGLRLDHPRSAPDARSGIATLRKLVKSPLGRDLRAQSVGAGVGG